MNKTYLIFGFEKSGQAAFNLIYNKIDFFYIYDDNKQKQKIAEDAITNKTNVLVLYELSNDLLKKINTIIISPGVSIFHPFVVLAKKRNIEVLSELELGFRYLKKVKLIAITGTNGKTTTTRLIEDILKCAKKRVYACGNIGTPICETAKIAKRGDFLVCETSSFQLEAVKSFKPDIACVLNITPDHINRHKTFRCYKKTKLNIVKNFDKKSIFIYNSNIKLNLKNKNFIKYKINSKKHINSCFVSKNSIYYKRNNKASFVISKQNIPLIGNHNIQNVMFATTVCKILKIKNKYIVNAIKHFKLNNHRLQLVYSNQNASFYDDSKATNIDATICAIKSFNNSTLLILGGSDKGYDYDKVFQNLPKYIKYIFACGEVKNKILESAKKYNKDIMMFDNLKQATTKACNLASNLNGKLNVLLSPASASFDEFKNYKQRGEKFLEYIKDYYETK
ncbi:MAG: UDP-N-acetylmuramoyl-L-alanine--D-glutamate ligase [Clostridia bacterium]|nr:UDP-N-acetylmuramoyl-L-alanine--D-glutamate ligase [Clostridia bacterium]